MIRVGVIRGGVSSEYDVSLATGSNVLSHLRGDTLSHKYVPIDILIDKEGVWHMQGKPASMENVFHCVDVIFNALHGDFGEDGKVQQMLEQWQIPYTGSGPFASAVAYNKLLSKEQFSHLGVKTAQHVICPPYNEAIDGTIEMYAKSNARTIWEKMSPPWVVKPVSSGSSVGVHIAKTYPNLVEAFEQAANEQIPVFIEEMIEGKEATVAVIEEFRGRRAYTLPPIEIRVPKSNSFFDYEAKYSGISKEICPGNFTSVEKEELERLASLIHTGLNLDHYSRSDFIVHPKRGIYALEVNTLPGLTDESLVPKALSAVGATMPDFIDHLLRLALQNR
jgi:D-alanine-D-alanine ligase